MTTIEVPVTTITIGSERTYQWACPFDGRRMTAGKHGVTAGCDHKAILKARSFLDLVAVFTQSPSADPK